MPKILVIVGPTASGKSDLAVRLAQKLNGEVISADSRQVYKGLNVGTGKITKREMKGIPHHLLDVVEPKKQFSVSDYKTLAENSLRYIVVKNKLPIIVGGSGFYIDTLVGRATIPEVPINKTLRKKLERLSAEKLFAMLKKKDSVRAKTIDKHNKVRLIRALEIVAKLGKVPSTDLSPTPLLDLGEGRRGKVVWVGLKPRNLEQRIYKRLLKRIPGIIRETKKLSKKRAHELGLEYRYASLYLQNKLTRKEFIEKLYTAICQYAKRQMTWFKRNQEIRWFSDGKSAYAAILSEMAGAKQPRSQLRNNGDSQ